MRISQDLGLRVLDRVIQGAIYRHISEEFGVSIGEVSNIVKEARCKTPI